MSDTPLKVMQGALTDQRKPALLNRFARAAFPADCESIAQHMSAARKALDRGFDSLFASAVTIYAGGALNIEEARDRAKTLAELLDRFA